MTLTGNPSLRGATVCCMFRDLFGPGSNTWTLARGCTWKGTAGVRRVPIGSRCRVNEEMIGDVLPLSGQSARGLDALQDATATE
jgi:hypothetical protein